MDFQAAEIHRFVQENREEAIDCLRELLATPSNSGEEVAVSKVFCRWIERAGLEPTVVGISEEHPNVLAEWFGSNPGKRFVFNGHMDTFPPTDGDEGTYGPYSGMVADNAVYGRGASDMKGGDAAALMAVAFLKRMGFDPKGSVLLSYLCDEELGGRYGSKWLAPRGYLDGDFGICMEQTDSRILIGHSGMFRIYVIYHAPAQHSARPHTKKNALEKAVIAINALYTYRDQVVRKKKDPIYESSSLEITMMNAGAAPNVHAAEARFAIDYRMIPSETLEEVSRAIFGILDALKMADPDMDYEYELISDRPGLSVDEKSDIVRACKEAYEKVTGKPAEVFYRHGGSDAATIQKFNNIPMPNWCFAVTAYVGLPDERFDIDDYLLNIEAYMLTLVKLMG